MARPNGIAGGKRLITIASLAATLAGWGALATGAATQSEGPATQAVQTDPGPRARQARAVAGTSAAARRRIGASARRRPRALAVTRSSR